MLLSSIKMRLLFWSFVTFSIVFTCLGLFLYFTLKSTVIASVENHLHSEVQLIASLLEVDDDHYEIDMGEAATGEYAQPLSGHYYQIISQNGKITARSPSLSLVDARLPVAEIVDEYSYSTINWPANEPLRMLSQTFTTKSGKLTIQAAEPLEESYNLINEFRNLLLVIFPLTFIISAVGIIIISKYSLKRIDTFSDKVGHITEKNLNERLEEEGVEEELRVLASSFNMMMEKLETSFLKQGRFLSDASHDLRTPVSIIKSNCDIILKKERSADEYIKALQRIGTTSNKMKTILNQILQVSRLESKTFALNMETINLKEILSRISNALSSRAAEASVEIKVEGKETNISGDRERLREAFMNIIENAIKYNKVDGSVDISISKIESEAVISITDKGIGIAEDELDKIFNRFFRADKSRGVVEGSGLGLSIVKAIIEAHKGRIKVDSVPNEEGTSFTVFLPM